MDSWTYNTDNPKSKPSVPTAGSQTEPTTTMSTSTATSPSMITTALVPHVFTSMPPLNPHHNYPGPTQIKIHRWSSGENPAAFLERLEERIATKNLISDQLLSKLSDLLE